MESKIIKKVIESSVQLTLSGEEAIAISNALSHLYNYTQGGLSPTADKLRGQFYELSQELNPLN